MRFAFSDLFPIPKYLTPPAVGIAVSDDCLRVVELGRNHGILKLVRYAEERLEPGVIELGVIKKLDHLTRHVVALRDIFKLRNVSVALPEDQVYVLRLHLPAMKKKDIRGAIELQLEEYVPLPPSEVYFDYEASPHDEVNDGSFDVSVTVIPKTVVNDYLEAFRRAGIEPVAFETESQSIARAVIPQGSTDRYMIANIGRVRTSFCIVNDGIVRFSTIVPIGGDSFANVIQKVRGVSYDAAVRTMSEHGIGRTKDSNELFALLLPSLSALKDEIVRHYVYWNTLKDDRGVGRNKIETILLSGESSYLTGLADYLSYGVDGVVRCANPWVNVMSFERDIPEMPYVKSLGFSAAIGLALRTLP